MTPWTILRRWYVFLIRERLGRRRQLVLAGVTDEDRRLHLQADRDLRDVRTTLRFLDNESDVFRRPE